MDTSKIQVKVGHVEFTIDGEKDWVATQLTKVLGELERLVKLSPVEQTEPGGTGPDVGGGARKNGAKSSATLSTFLRDKGATANQTKKFLATALWLQDAGATRLTTSDITKALSNSQQTKLTNPAQCLNNNVLKGYCEKESGKFYVTEHGRDSLGTKKE